MNLDEKHIIKGKKKHIPKGEKITLVETISMFPFFSMIVFHLIFCDISTHSSLSHVCETLMSQLETVWIPLDQTI